MLRKAFVVGVAGWLAASTAWTADAQDYPSQPIKVIVPLAAGGGIDAFARMFAKAIEADGSLAQPIVVTNMPGAGGAIGMRAVAEAESDGYTLLNFHSSVLTAPVTGQVDFGLEAFEPIAQTGDQFIVLAVRNDSKYKTLQDVIEQSRREPRSVLVATNLGAIAHFAPAMVSDAAGVEFKYVQVGGGAKALASVLGGHTDIAVFALAGFSKFRQNGVRGLVILAPERHPDLPNIPTARELGYDVIASVPDWWLAPAGTPKDRIDKFADVLEKLMATQEIQSWLKSRMNDPVFIRGEALKEKMQEQYDHFDRIAESAGIKDALKKK